MIIQFIFHTNKLKYNFSSNTYIIYDMMFFQISDYWDKTITRDRCFSGYSFIILHLGAPHNPKSGLIIYLYYRYIGRLG